MKKFAIQFMGQLIVTVLLLYIESHNAQKRKTTGPNCENVSSKDDPTCGVSKNTAVTRQLPWHVVIRLPDNGDLMCGGSIISDSWVLTAGHCCIKYCRRYGGEGGFNKCGLHNSLLLMFGAVTANDTTALNMTATEFYVHPKYSITNENNDVCLIKLPEILEFSETIAPVHRKNVNKKIFY